MLGSILNVIRIKKEIPEAIGYHSFGPVEFPVPGELINISSDEELVLLARMSILYFSIDNYSSKLTSKIRILYSGDFQYLPKINYDSRNVKVEFEVKKDRKEIYIEELPPNESVSISFFNTDDDFKIEQVLIGDKMITSTMNKRAEIKRYHSLNWWYLLTLFAISISFFTVGYSLYIMNENAEINQMMSEAYSNLGYMECQPFMFDNKLGNEQILERKYQQLSNVQQDNTLILNNVLTYEKLKVKDKILFCLPEKS